MRLQGRQRLPIDADSKTTNPGRHGMPEDAIRKESREHEAEQGQRDEQAETVKRFVKPTLTRHESLPTVTAGAVVGGGSP